MSNLVSKVMIVAAVCIVFSCNDDKGMKSNFIDQVIDMAIESSQGEPIEFPELYENWTSYMPPDSLEKVTLVEKLKQKGFKVTKWGRGNNPPLSFRVVSFELKRRDCKCEVLKSYNYTQQDSLYQLVERLRCWNLKMKR